MELLRIGPVGREQPAVRADDGTSYSLTDLTQDIDGRFLGDDGIARVQDALAKGRLPVLPISPGERIGAPVARPGAVVCIGQNYAAHAAESGSPVPAAPIIFFKHPNTVIGPNDDVLIPPGADKVDWEVELAVVIGRQARYLSSPEDAPRHIAGFCISNDVSERSYQLDHSGGQWSKGKSCESFNPLGPFLVPVADLDPARPLRLRSWVNGEPRQDSTTADMVFSVNELVHHLSHYLVLEPGDVINTGTPQGVALSGRFPYLRAGDQMKLEITGLGSQQQRLVDAR